MPILDSTIAAVFVRFVNADEQPIRTSCPSTFAIPLLVMNAKLVGWINHYN
jgi:hypothetical protein